MSDFQTDEIVMLGDTRIELKIIRFEGTRAVVERWQDDAPKDISQKIIDITYLRKKQTPKTTHKLVGFETVFEHLSNKETRLNSTETHYNNKIKIIFSGFVTKHVAPDGYCMMHAVNVLTGSNFTSEVLINELSTKYQHMFVNAVTLVNGNAVNVTLADEAKDANGSALPENWLLVFANECRCRFVAFTYNRTDNSYLSNVVEPSSYKPSSYTKTYYLFCIGSGTIGHYWPIVPAEPAEPAELGWKNMRQLWNEKKETEDHVVAYTNEGWISTWRFKKKKLYKKFNRQIKTVLSKFRTKKVAADGYSMMHAINVLTGSNFTKEQMRIWATEEDAKTNDVKLSFGTDLQEPVNNLSEAWLKVFMSHISCRFNISCRFIIFTIHHSPTVSYLVQDIFVENKALPALDKTYFLYKTSHYWPLKSRFSLQETDISALKQKWLRYRP